MPLALEVSAMSASRAILICRSNIGCDCRIALSEFTGGKTGRLRQSGKLSIDRDVSERLEGLVGGA